MVQEVSQKSDIEPLLQQLSEKAQIERQNVEIKSVVASWNLGDGESETIIVGLRFFALLQNLTRPTLLRELCA